MKQRKCMYCKIMKPVDVFIFPNEKVCDDCGNSCTRAWWWCEVCTKYIKKKGWKIHTKSNKHIKNKENRGY